MGRVTDDWYVFALTVIGIILVIWQVPMTLSSIAVNLTYGLYNESGGHDWQIYMRQQGWALVLQSLIKFALGMYLIFGSRGLVSIIRRLRGQAEETGR
ncbi:MAG: hypothetical protein Q8O92_09185 [Candidatus Latescibacter sp.]|nr:hypothetical protein [Candidatus Latescibacter sp.]